MLTNSDLTELVAFRRELHRRPEISGEERETAATVVRALEDLQPSRILTGLGGHGVAAVFEGAEKGPTVLFRCELDGLPIQEETDVAWASEMPGKGHLCGHDWHMTMVLALGGLLARSPIKKGRAVLMFQPAEEDGSGARAVAADPAYASIAPDFAFAIHNEPGRPFGYVSTRTGLINCASQGLQITYHGKTAHAAEPEMGVSPVGAIARLVPQLEALGVGSALTGDFRLATITHINVGEPTFGIAPADGVLNITLRAAQDAGLAEMVAAARAIAVSEAGGMLVETADCDVFAATVNDVEAVAIAEAALDALGVEHGDENLPMRASEDFGVFGWGANVAMLCLGLGRDHAAPHNPDYDFPDDLIPIGVGIFERIARDLLG